MSDAPDNEWTAIHGAVNDARKGLKVATAARRLATERADKASIGIRNGGALGHYEQQAEKAAIQNELDALEEYREKLVTWNAYLEGVTIS